MRDVFSDREASNPQGAAGVAPRVVVLRIGGIYRVPDGGEYVCGAGGEGHYFFYHPLAWQGSRWIVNMPVAYEADARRGVLTGAGAPTGWRMEDLSDTQRTVERGPAQQRARGRGLRAGARG